MLREDNDQVPGTTGELVLPNGTCNLRRGFLAKLKSSGKLDYKRYLASPLRYAGGKSLAVGYVVERIPDNVNRLVSPFMGGGAVEIACAKELNMQVVAYDVFDILCAYWQFQIRNAEDLYKRLGELNPNRDTFRSVKETLKAHWNGDHILEGLELATLYYFNSNTSYGPSLSWVAVRHLPTACSVRENAGKGSGVPRSKVDGFVCAI